MLKVTYWKWTSSWCFPILREFTTFQIGLWGFGLRPFSCLVSDFKLFWFWCSFWNSDRSAIKSHWERIYNKNTWRCPNLRGSDSDRCPHGAADRTWTGTVSLPRDFKSLASAGFATAAYLILYHKNFGLSRDKFEFLRLTFLLNSGRI